MMDRDSAIARARSDPHRYRDEVAAEALAFLERSCPESVGQATIMVMGALLDTMVGDDHHDQVLIAGLGLAVDQWADREATIRAALAHANAAKA